MSREFRGYSHELTSAQARVNAATHQLVSSTFFPEDVPETTDTQPYFGPIDSLQFTLLSIGEHPLKSPQLNDEEINRLHENGIDPENSTVLDLLNASGQIPGVLEIREIDGKKQVMVMNGINGMTLDVITSRGKSLAIPKPIRASLFQLAEAQQAMDRITQYSLHHAQPVQPISKERNREAINNEILIRETLKILELSVKNGNKCTPLKNHADDGNLSALSFILTTPRIQELITHLRNSPNLIQLPHSDYVGITTYVSDLSQGDNIAVYHQYFKGLRDMVYTHFPDRPEFENALLRWKKLRKENKEKNKGGYVVFSPIPIGDYRPTHNLAPVSYLRDVVVVAHCQDIQDLK